MSKEQVGDRIKELRGKTSLVDFSILFEIHRNTLRAYESNSRYPDSRLLSAICKKYQVNADWLLLGMGPKSIDESPTVELNQEILTDAIAALEEALESKGRVMTPENKAEIISEIYMLISEEEQGDNRGNITKILKLVA